MKKVIIPIVILIALVFTAYLLLFKKKEQSHEKLSPISVNSSDSLNGSIDGALQAYFTMKDAFVKSDTALVNSNASAFVIKLDLMKFADTKTDSTIIQLASQIKETISSQAKTIVSTTGIDAKRKIFQTVSDGMFDLLRTVRYNGSTVYQDYCPMAFNNAGAAWLSNSREIVNPYFGEKMLHCGELRDSVSISK